MFSKYETTKRKTVNQAITAARIAIDEYDNINESFLEHLSESIQDCLSNLPDNCDGKVPLETLIGYLFDKCNKGEFENMGIFDVDLNTATMADWIWMFRHAVEVGEFYISHDKDGELFISLK